MVQRPDANLLHLEKLTKIFTIRAGLTVTRFSAVDNATVTLTADRPEIFAVAGESGSGKTTLARMVLGLERPTGGNMYYKDRDVTELSRHERRSWFQKEIQPVFQDPFATFSPLKRIDSYLYETALNYKMVSRAEVDDYLDDVLRVVGLSMAEVKGRYPSELSGGQAQRISVARALVTRPSLIIADEPVSMLDASLRMSIVNLFKNLKEDQGVSVLYITHDLATAYYAADRIAIMLRGWIVEAGPVEEVLGNPLHPYSKNLKESVPEADPDKVWETKTTLAVSATEEFTLEGCRYAGRCPMVMDRCHKEIPPEYEVQGRAVKCFLYEDEAKAGVN